MPRPSWLGRTNAANSEPYSRSTIEKPDASNLIGDPGARGLGDHLRDRDLGDAERGELVMAQRVLDDRGADLEQAGNIEGVGGPDRQCRHGCSCAVSMVGACVERGSHLRLHGLMQPDRRT